MNVLFDTSVLVAAMVEAHPMHERALPWLQRVKEKTITGIVAAHSIAELYAVLTNLPVHPRISPQIASRLIKQNVLDLCRVVPLTEADYGAVVQDLSDREITGSVIYDALILYTAVKTEVDSIVTLNVKDFCRAYPVFADKISSP